MHSGREAAALLFGGLPTDYAISTNPNTTDPSTITRTAFYSTIETSGCGEFGEDASVDDGPPGYEVPHPGGAARSAYVDDNCTGVAGTNHVWRMNSPPVSVPAVPVPTLGDGALLLMSLVAAGLGARRLRRT